MTFLIAVSVSILLIIAVVLFFKREAKRWDLDEVTQEPIVDSASVLPVDPNEPKPKPPVPYNRDVKYIKGHTDSHDLAKPFVLGVQIMVRDSGNYELKFCGNEKIIAKWFEMGEVVSGDIESFILIDRGDLDGVNTPNPMGVN